MRLLKKIPAVSEIKKPLIVFPDDSIWPIPRRIGVIGTAGSFLLLNLLKQLDQLDQLKLNLKSKVS